MIQKFYAAKSALQVEHSKNGLFVVVANLLKVENDVKYYDWENKKTVLIKIDEALMMSEALQVYIDKGADAFHDFCQMVFRNPKYKNLVFVHDKSKRGGGKILTNFGLQEYNGYMSFILHTNDLKMSVSLDYPSLIRLKEFLRLISWQEMRKEENRNLN